MRIGLFLTSQRDGRGDQLVELGRYYDAGAPTREEVGAHLDGDLIGPMSAVKLVTAEADDGEVIGLAALVILPSLVEVVGPGRRQCVLKELFVTQSYRSAGVGESLLRWSAGYARDQGCGRMDWNVKAGNADGIRFYERHGACVVGDRLSYRVEGTRLGDLARPWTS